MLHHGVPSLIGEIAGRPGGRKLMDIPELPGQVLRRIRVAALAADLSMSPKRYMGLVDDHFGQLREHCGMPMPEFTFYLDKETTSVYTLVDFIMGESLEDKPDSYLKEPHIRPYTGEIADALSNYLDWFSRRNRPYLHDISSVRQYIVGYNPRNEAGNHAYMSDIDPYLEAATGRWQGSHVWESWQSDLEQWSKASTLDL